MNTLPPREQKLLLMRLAALYGPEALAFSPRSPRQASETEVRVVVGLQALTRAVAEVEHLSAEAKSSGATHSYDEVTQLVQPERQSGIDRAPGPRLAVEARRSQRDRVPDDRAGQGRAQPSLASCSPSENGDVGRSRSCAACSASRSRR